MEIVNFGHFKTEIKDSVLCHTNEDGHDWYELRVGLTEWSATGDFLTAIYGAWAMVDPATMRVTNVEFDPSRLVPNDKILLGIDAAVADIKIGMLFANGALVDSPLPITTFQVDVERDRRIDAGFIFQDILFQSDEGSRENIAGAKSAATDAIALGAQVDDYSWQRLLDANGAQTFVWIAADNSLHPMDAQTMVKFGYTALNHKQGMIFKARDIKAMDPIPLDYATNDAYWT